jgi:hypothetical protein
MLSETARPCWPRLHTVTHTPLTDGSKTSRPIAQPGHEATLGRSDGARAASRTAGLDAGLERMVWVMRDNRMTYVTNETCNRNGSSGSRAERVAMTATDRRNLIWVMPAQGVALPIWDDVV